jgi:DNA-directed RNA polymerase specialized sigma24 family protein
VGAGRALLRVAYLLIQDRHRAADLLQEVLVKAYRRWRRIEAPDRYVRRALAAPPVQPGGRPRPAAGRRV